ncbi:Protein argonaute, N-terminal, partial [Dillenia turbinata]
MCMFSSFYKFLFIYIFFFRALDKEMANNEEEALPPPPAVVPGNGALIRVRSKKPLETKRFPMARPGLGTKGQRIKLLTNHFRVGVANTDQHFYQYHVSLFNGDGHPVEAKGCERKVLDKVQEIYSGELAGKDFAYDGEKSLFTLGPLPRQSMEFPVVLENVVSAGARSNGDEGDGSPYAKESKRLRRQNRSKMFKVEINYATEIPIQAIASTLLGAESERFQDAMRVLDVILRQNAAKRGCLLVRQSFFQNDPRNFVELSGGVLGCRGFHSSFRATQSGLSLNLDVSTTLIVKPVPALDFLLENQNVTNPNEIDWGKAKRMLKSLRIKVAPNNLEYKVTGLSPKICRDQTFLMKQRNDDGEEQCTELTVYDYFKNYRNIHVRHAEFPCIDVGKGKKPIYFPIELCTMLSLQRYTKSLSSQQRAMLVEKSRQKPQERMNVLTNALRWSNYEADPMLLLTGISIAPSFTQKLVQPTRVENWAIVNFSARCDIRYLTRALIKCAEMKGIVMNEPLKVYQEDPKCRREVALTRVDTILNYMKSDFKNPPRFILCILPEKKNCDVYGPWKRRCLADHGIVTQCMAPPPRINDQYFTNLLLKINAKLGGMNSFLSCEQTIPIVSDVPTMILGMDIWHGSAGQSNLPSIAAVTGSREWPLVSRYGACTRVQSPKAEMIDDLFKPEPNTNKDDGIMRELLLEFYGSTRGRKPENIIIFRDGVSESQFNQVLNLELDSIMEACKFLDETWFPKFTLIIAQKRHHTTFFQASAPDNVPPGTVIDNSICHPKNNDFYLCAQAGMI